MRSLQRVRCLQRLGVLLSLLAGLAGLAGCISVPGGRGGPLHERETGLPGGVTEDRWWFGLFESRSWPDGTQEEWARFLGGRVEVAGGPAAGPASGAAAGAPESGVATWETRASRWTVLPPIATGTDSPERTQTTVWPFYFDSSVGTPADRAGRASDDDTWIAPFLAWGHEPDQDDYFALFPVYGTLRQKLLADRLDFAMFPAWTTTRAGAWRSTHVMWPLVAWGEGEGRTHRRFLPFWSQSDSAKRHSRTVLWPLVHWSTETREDRTTDGWFLFPLGGRRDSRDGSFAERSILWPFFEWSDDARTGDRYRAMPFPFYRDVERPGVSRSTWYWPFHGSFRSETETSDFYAWPIVWTGEYTGDGRRATRRMVVPLWMERSSGASGQEPDHRELRAWPLFSYERTPDGYERIRAPEIIPFFGWRSGESVWADGVALWRWRADRDGRAAWDLPMSVVRWRRDARGAATLTLLWWIDIPLGGGTRTEESR